MDIPVEISRIIITELSEQQIVFLREVGGHKSFPIVIGIAEALAIDRRLKGIPFPRPLTHDFTESAINALGGKIDRVVITDVSDHTTFYASLFIVQNGKLIEIDCRPSDALALAAGTEIPIFADMRVIKEMTMPPIDTKEDRINVLIQRRELLITMIDEARELLASEHFLETAPEDVVIQSREQLAQMKIEFEAINDLLDRLT